MGKQSITIHGLIVDLLNYKRLIEEQSKTPAFLDQRMSSRKVFVHTKSRQFIKYRKKNKN